MASISGTVALSGSIDKWAASAFRAITHAFEYEAYIVDGAYTIQNLEAGVPYIVVCRPVTEGIWTASTTMLKNKMFIASAPSVTPYIFKATTATDFTHIAMACDVISSTTTFTNISTTNILYFSRSGGAYLSDTDKVYGNASVLFDGAGDYLSASVNSALRSQCVIGTQDFQVSFYVKFNSAPDANGDALFLMGGSTSNRPLLCWRNGSNQLELGLMSIDTTYTPLVTAAGVCTQDTWHFVSFSRRSGVGSISVDGVECANGNLAINADSEYNYTVYLGRMPWLTAADFNGRLDDITFSIGTDNGYFGTYTPPVASRILVTGSSEPTWNTTVGGTTNDGTVVWTNMGAIPQPLAHGPIVAA